MSETPPDASPAQKLLKDASGQFLPDPKRRDTARRTPAHRKLAGRPSALPPISTFASTSDVDPFLVVSTGQSLSPDSPYSLAPTRSQRGTSGNNSPTPSRRQLPRSPDNGSDDEDMEIETNLGTPTSPTPVAGAAVEQNGAPADAPPAHDVADAPGEDTPAPDVAMPQAPPAADAAADEEDVAMAEDDPPVAAVQPQPAPAQPQQPPIPMFQAPPAAPPQAQPAAPPQAPPALPQQPVAPQLPAAPPAFTIPSIDELSAQVPTHRAENPNTRKQTAKGIPPLTNDGKVAFQRCMAGRWDEPVITMATINRGVATKQINEVRTNAHRYLAFVLADGGRFLLENLPFIKAEILAGLSGLANGDDLTLHPPVAHAVQEDSTKYGGGRAIFAEFTNLAARTRVLQFAPTFAVKSENTLAFHAVTINYSRESWAVAGFYTNSTLPPAIQTSALRAAIIHDSLETPTIVQEADQMIQGIVPGVTPQERAYEAFKSIDVQFMTHDEKPLLVVFRKPCAGDPEGNKRLNKMLGSAIYGVGNMEFRPFNANGNPLHCVICVSDCHSAYICTFVRGPDPWWGPPDQLSAITTGPLAPKASNANTSRGNGHRNDGTPMRGGAGGGRGGRRGGRDGRGRRGNY